MKKILVTFVLLFPIAIIGQTETENYIKTTSYLQEVDEVQENNVLESQKIENITYYDGLGRVIQTIAVRAGGQNQNITTHIEYDDLGRTTKTYLPYATDTEIPNPLNFTTPSNLKSSINQFYNTSKYENTQNPYAETVYGNSSLQRVLEEAAPGNSWALNGGHTIKFNFLTNSNDEVRYFDVNFIGGNHENPEIILNGYYDAGRFYKNVIKDENWTPASGNNHTVEEFTNKLGQVVLKRTYNDNLAHDTYYVYDNYGNLTFVLSPQGSDDIVIGDVLVNNSQEVLNDLCYQYKYDERNRLIEKKVPGKGWEYIVYNKINKPILTQDANQRNQSPKEWFFTKYDAFGRIAYTGIKKSNISRTSFQTIANNNQQQYETISSISETIQGIQVYYSNYAIPSTFGLGDEILTVSYYDQYIDHDGINLPTQIYGQNVTNQAQGLPTVSKIRVLDSDDWITSIISYDLKGRPIYNFSYNSYFGSNHTVENLLDFTGNVIERKTVHSKGLHQHVITNDYYTYDHQNRLLSHKQKVDNEPLQLIASNIYDELGQLISKDVGGETTFDGYTDMIKVSIDQEGNIEKLPDNNTDNAWDAKLKTKGEIKEDGGIRFITPHDAFRFYRVGLINTNSFNEDDRYFDYGIYIKAGDDNNDGFSDVNIILNSISPITTYVGKYEAGDIFKIERRNGEILFKKNNVTFYTVAVDTDITFVGKATLFSYNSKIDDLTLFGDYIDKKLQRVDYEYNVRGWLTDINPFDSFNKTTNLFNFHINYDGTIEGSAGDTGQAIPLYNGNISQTIWKTANTDNQKRGYGYTYDALNRFKEAHSRKGNDLTSNDNFYVFGTGYDKNGNIISIKRNSTNEYGLASRMDDLTYSYNGNQLKLVSEGASTTIKNEGFYDGNTTGDDYDYDTNGNMIMDKNKGVENITYNYLNLPESIEINTSNDGYGNAQEGTISYVYDATGIKLSKVVRDNIQNTTISTFYLEGGYIYENNNGVEKLKMFPHPEGYIEPVHNDNTKSITKFNKTTQQTSSSEYQYAFNYTDHLGNVRLTYSDSDGNGSIQPSSEIISEKHYYPFGLQHSGYNEVVTSNKNDQAENFNYLGQEQQPELGLNWLTFRYRNYMPEIGRFFGVDPVAEEYQSISTYQFAHNSPIWKIELEGLEGVTTANTDVLNSESVDPPRVLAVFYHGGPTGGGRTTDVESAGGTGEIYSATQASVEGAGREFVGRIIAPGATQDSGVRNGFNFIAENYREGDQIVIYGYSYGGDNAVNLAEKLQEQGVNVDTMIIVDSSDGPGQGLTVDTSVPDNVSYTENIYQDSNSGASSSSRSTGATSSGTSSQSSNRSKSGRVNSPGSRGSRHSGEGANVVYNRNVSSPRVNHGNIQKEEQKNITNTINTRLQNYETRTGNQ